MPHRRVFIHSTTLGEMNYEFTLVNWILLERICVMVENIRMIVCSFHNYRYSK